MALSPEEQTARLSAERAVLTALLQAAVAGDFAALQRVADAYVQKHGDLTAAAVLTQFKDAQRRTALHFACASARPEAVATAGNATCTASETAGEDEEDIVEKILQWLPPNAVAKIIRCKDAEGLTPLMLAAQCFDPSTAERRIRALLRAGGMAASVPADTSGGGGSSSSRSGSSNSTTPLGLARSKAGATPLHYAAANGASAATVAALLQAGKVALRTFSLQGGTPLHWACSVPPPTNHTETMAALIAHGADVNARSETIPPPLVLAMAAGNDAHGAFLLQSGADVTASIHFVLQPGNVTMYHMAADMNLPGTLAQLIERCNDPSTPWQEQTNDQGYTSLDLAAKEGHTRCVTLLLTAAAATGNGATEDDAAEYIAKWRLDPAKAAEPALPTVPFEPHKPPSDSNDEDPIEATAKREAASILLQHSAATDGITDDAKMLALKHKAAGNAHYANHEWSAAATAYSAAVAADPTDAAFYSNRSACYLSLDQCDAALSDAVVARCLQPLWPKAAYRVAVARAALNRYEDAAVAAWEGLQLNPDSAELQRLLRACVAKGRGALHGASTAASSK